MLSNHSNNLTIEAALIKSQIRKFIRAARKRLSYLTTNLNNDQLEAIKENELNRIEKGEFSEPVKQYLKNHPESLDEIKAALIKTIVKYKRSEKTFNFRPKTIDLNNCTNGSLTEENKKIINKKMHYWLNFHTKNIDHTKFLELRKELKKNFFKKLPNFLDQFKSNDNAANFCEEIIDNYEPWTYIRNSYLNAISKEIGGQISQKDVMKLAKALNRYIQKTFKRLTNNSLSIKSKDATPKLKETYSKILDKVNNNELPPSLEKFKEIFSEDTIKICKIYLECYFQQRLDSQTSEINNQVDMNNSIENNIATSDDHLKSNVEICDAIVLDPAMRMPTDDYSSGFQDNLNYAAPIKNTLRPLNNNANDLSLPGIEFVLSGVNNNNSEVEYSNSPFAKRNYSDNDTNSFFSQNKRHRTENQVINKLDVMKVSNLI